MVVRTAKKRTERRRAILRLLTISYLPTNIAVCRRRRASPAPTPFEPAVVSTKERIFPKPIVARSRIHDYQVRFFESTAIPSVLLERTKSSEDKTNDFSRQTSIKTKLGSVGVAFAAAVGLRFCPFRSHRPESFAGIGIHCGRSRARHCDWFEYPDGGRSRPESSRHLSPGDIEKLGVRNPTDLLIKLPQEMGTAVNQNWSGVGDGSVIPNLRGLLPKETLVLIDGKRAAIAGGGGTFSRLPNAAGVDINLIPFPMIDHIDILKDGASAVYGSDAVAGVINIFLLHKFRGLEIGGSYGNTNMGASNDAGEWEGWLKAGTGDDKTDIVVIADFYNRAAIYTRDRDH